MERPSVFDFSDYRSFLKAYAQDKKRSSPYWSLGAWSRQLKLGGTASLTMVLNGQRKPGPKLSATLTEYFGFDDRERQYFYDLVRLEKTQDDSRLKVALMEELRKLSPKKDFALLDERTFSAIANWYFYVIRQLTRLTYFQEDPVWIREQLLDKSVTEVQIRTALQVMLELNILARDISGRIVAGTAGLTTSNDVANEAIKRFHEQIILQAKEAVRTFGPDQRELQALTIAFDSSRLNEAKIEIRNFISQFNLRFGGGDTANSVFQLQLSYFPQTQDGGNKQ